MKTMTKEEICAKVQKIHPGTFVPIRYQAGSGIALDGGTLWIVKERMVRFKLDYPKLWGIEHPTKGYERKHDKKYPFITYANNGNVMLTCFTTNAKNISTGAPWGRTHYIYEKGGKEIELLPENPKIATALEKAEKEALKKSFSHPTPIFTLGVKRIISIGGKEK